MYPPKVVDSLEEGLENLYASLTRAGDHWSGQYQMQDNGDGITRVRLGLRESLPEKCVGDVRSYIRGYIKASGWKVVQVNVRKNYVELLVSNA